jgi:hypothetical protein
MKKGIQISYPGFNNIQAWERELGVTWRGLAIVFGSLFFFSYLMLVILRRRFMIPYFSPKDFPIGAYISVAGWIGWCVKVESRGRGEGFIRGVMKRIVVYMSCCVYVFISVMLEYRYAFLKKLEHIHRGIGTRAHALSWSLSS